MAVVMILGSSRAQNFTSFITHLDSLENSDDKMAAVDSFMNLVTPLGIPYIEGDTANFIYRGEASTLQLAGDFNMWGLIPETLSQAEGTDFWYIQKIFENDARLDYKFILNSSSWILDPLNPNQVWGSTGPNSELAMSGYVQPWEISYNADIPHGIIIQDTIGNPDSSNMHQAKIYLPPAYSPSYPGGYPTAYFQDGFEYLDLGSAQNVMDNIIAAGMTDPFIAVFIKPNNRNAEYAGTLRNVYRLYIVNALVPYIDSVYATVKSARGRAILGEVYGGNVSALIAYNHPDIFGNCGLHSAAFLPNDFEAFKLVTEGSYEDIRWYSLWGSYDDIFQNMRDFRDSLTETGYDLEWKELHEGRSWGLWRANIDSPLEYFFPKGWSGIQDATDLPPMEVKIAPNPSRDGFRINFQMPSSGNWELLLSDVKGEKIKTIQGHAMKDEQVELFLSTPDLSNGIYIYKLSTGSENSSGKILISK